MTSVPRYAPGCFGSAVAFQAKELTCRNCTFNSDCALVAERNAEILREKFGLGSATQKVKPPAPVEKPKCAVNPEAPVMPERVRRLLSKIDGENLDILGKLQRSENPFDTSKFPALAIAAHLLLRIDKPLSRDTLEMALVSKMNWKKESAALHARITFYALNHVGAVISNDGLISLKGKRFAEKNT